MEEDVDDSADTTTPNALTASRNYRKIQRFRNNRKEKKSCHGSQDWTYGFYGFL